MKKKYDIDNILTANKVCQLLNNGNVDNLPTRFSSIISPSNLITTNNKQTTTVDSTFISSTVIDFNHVLLCYKTSTSVYTVVLTINAGIITESTPKIVTSYVIDFIKFTTLDSNHVVMCYKKDDNGFVYSIVLNIDNSNIITLGALCQINSLASAEINIISLDSTHALITYRPNITWRVCFMLLTINSTTIIRGSILELDSESVTTLIIGTNRVFITYNGTSNYLCSSILRVTNGILSFGRAVKMRSTTTQFSGAYTESVLLDENHVVITFSPRETYYLYAIALTIEEDDTITAGSIIRVNGVINDRIILLALNSNHVMINFTAGVSDINSLYSVVLTTTGNLLTLGTSIRISNVIVEDITSIVLHRNRVLLNYINTSDSLLYSVILSISGSTITPGIIYKVATNKVLYTDISLLNSTRFVLSYRNQDNTFLFSSAITYTDPLNLGKDIGITQDDTGIILIKGISKGHIGLITGSRYYYDTNGTISTDSSGIFIGRALSSTTIYVSDYIID